MFILNNQTIPLPDEVCVKLYDTISMHIDKVQKFGYVLEVPYNRLFVHDASKFTFEEFYGYARHHCGDKGDPNAYAKAWLHHVNHNDHHWNHWVFSDGWHMDGSDMEGSIVRMPHDAVLEMIADWQAASYVYSGNKDLMPWLIKSAPRIVLHTESAKILRDTLYCFGYKDIHDIRFKNELN